MDISRLLSERARSIDASGIRRVFDLGRSMTNPINLSVGQPDFPVPEPIKRAAVQAITEDNNGYSVTQGIAELRDRTSRHLAWDLGWDRVGAETGLVVSSGTSGALLLAMQVLLDTGDEIVIPDPYFVMYPHVATMCGAKAVRCSTYPDFRMTADRVEPLLTERTKAVLLNTPGNPSGVVMTQEECRDLLALCRERGVLLISDEIYDEFTFADGMTAHATGDASVARCPSPCREAGSEEDVLLVRGFGKTYGCTGWRMGYAAGPKQLIEEMTKFQQYTFVCAPSIAQWGCIEAFDCDMSRQIEEYTSRRDMVVERLGEVTEVAKPSGAFYAFFKVPESLGLSGMEFVERCVERQLLVIPGGVFSDRDTHVRLSFAAPRDQIERGLEVLVDLMRGA